MMGFLIFLAVIVLVTVAPMVLWVYGGVALHWGLDHHPRLTWLILLLLIVFMIAAVFVSIKFIGPACRVHFRMFSLPC